MSNSDNQLGGKCPYMPYLGRGQMSGGTCPTLLLVITDTHLIHRYKQYVTNHVVYKIQVSHVTITWPFLTSGWQKSDLRPLNVQ